MEPAGQGEDENVAPDPSRVWLPELVQRIASFLPANEVPLILRLVNHVTAAQFRRSPAHTTVRLSLPVPLAEFTRKWISPPNAMHRLTLKQRCRLVRCTAASGVVANIEALLDAWPEHCQLRGASLKDAARGGSVEMCEFLKARGALRDGHAEKAYYVLMSGSVEAQKHEAVALWLLDNGADHGHRVHEQLSRAAGAGMAQLCQRLLMSHIDRAEWAEVHEAAASAARHGHAELTDQLLTLLIPKEREAVMDYPDTLLIAAAQGLELASLQHLYRQWVDHWDASAERPAWDAPGDTGSSCGGLGATAEMAAYLDDRKAAILGAAAASITEDWADKVVWLEEARGYQATTAAACGWVVDLCHKDSMLERLRWLTTERGYPLGADVVRKALRAGHVAVLCYLRDEKGLQLEGRWLPCTTMAALTGDLEFFRALHTMPEVYQVSSHDIQQAAANGHTATVMHLVEASGQDLTAPEAAPLLKHAAGLGQLELVVWLRERGCPWSDSTFVAAAGAEGGDSGGVELLEYLRDHGCSMGGAENFAVAAAAGCEARLAWLLEAGCAMGDDGEAYVVAARNGDVSTLRFLRQQLSCPWSADGSTFTQAVSTIAVNTWKKEQENALHWLLDNGCIVEWSAAEAVAKRFGCPGLTKWLKREQEVRMA